MNSDGAQINKDTIDTSALFSIKKLSKITLDALLLSLAYFLSYLIRFDFNIPHEQFALIKVTLPVAVLMNIAFINLLRINLSQWRYSSIQDLINLLGAVSAGWIGFIIYLYFLNLLSVPRSVLTIFWMLSIIILGGARFVPRVYLKLLGMTSSKKCRVLVIGAGDAGEMIIRQMKNDPKLGYYPVALIDDDHKKLNTKIHGVKVVGNINNLNQIIQKRNVDEIIISAPSAHPKEMQRIVQACEATGIEFKTVPGPREIVNGFVKLDQIRKVRVEDLLDRSPVEIDLEKIKEYLNEKVVLITGAGGSIGSELSRQILSLNPQKLLCLDRAENSLFYLDYELNQMGSSTNFEIIIADVLDTSKIGQILQKHKPDVVFHAAAYKHVPMMELHPEAAVRNNILGTLNMVKLSENYGVDKFVLISTDKAVNPTSVMGATKRVAELLLQSFTAKARIKLLTVRFGNVLGSFGSVIPLFQKQIAQGGPVTITHPEMQRFFMTIPESVKLILQAAKMSNGNDIFVLDMGEPIKLINIARRLIKLSGYIPDKDIAIEVIGTRPGEKLNEELWNHGEVPLKTDHSKIFMAIGSHYNHWDLMSKNLDLLNYYAENGKRDEIYKKLQEIIPEYKPDVRLHKQLSALQSTPLSE